MATRWAVVWAAVAACTWGSRPHPVVAQMDAAAMSWPEHGEVRFSVHLQEIDETVQTWSNRLDLSDEERDVLAIMRDVRFEGRYDFDADVSSATMHTSRLPTSTVRAQGLEMVELGVKEGVEAMFMSLAVHSGTLLQGSLDVSEEDAVYVVNNGVDTVRVRRASGLPQVVSGTYEGQAVEQRFVSWVSGDQGAMVSELSSRIDENATVTMTYVWSQHDGKWFPERVDVVSPARTYQLRFEDVQWLP